MKKPDTRNYGKDHPRFFAEGGAVGDDYNTDLGPDEAAFQADKARDNPNDSGVDYDLRGAWKAGSQRAPGSGGHMADTFKKPNHPTFSDQSKYATGDQRGRAGHWDGDTFIPPANK